MSKSDKIISLKIDVTKIEKERLYQGKKGKYLDAVLFYREEEDQYGQSGMIVQSVSKEERDDGVQGPILGNAKILGQQNKPAPSQEEEPQPDDDDLPF